MNVNENRLTVSLFCFEWITDDQNGIENEIEKEQMGKKRKCKKKTGQIASQQTQKE